MSAKVKTFMVKVKWKHYVNYALVIAAMLIILIADASGLLSRTAKTLLVPIAINIILAVSLNLLVGFLGELTLGHAGFMAVGAYCGCLAAAALPAAPNGAVGLIYLILAMLVGGSAAAVFGILIGTPVLRLKGDYVAIVTLAFGQIIVSIINNLSFTGGAMGLDNIPALPKNGYLIAFVMVIATLLVIENLIRSRHGRAIEAIRDNLVAAKSMGLNVTYYKIIAFVVSAFFAGVAGVLYGANLTSIKPTTFDYNKSIEILVMVVLGGMGSITGSIIAATLITILPEALRFMADYRMILYAVVLIVMMILNASPKFAHIKSKLNFKSLWRYIAKKISGRKAPAAPKISDSIEVASKNVDLKEIDDTLKTENDRILLSVSLSDDNKPVKEE